jgi:hypothetical protein
MTEDLNTVTTQDSASLPSSMDEVEMGRVLAGAVQAVKPYGVFVRPAWGLDRATVLVPTRLLANFFIQTPEDVLDVDQTLFVRKRPAETVRLCATIFFNVAYPLVFHSGKGIFGFLLILYLIFASEGNKAKHTYIFIMVTFCWLFLVPY